MKFIVDAPGQTCNRLWSYLDTISWAIANKKRVHIWFWDPSIKHFDNLRNGKYSKFPFYNKRVITFIGESRLLTVLFYILDNIVFHKFYRSKFAEKLGLVCGWEHRDDSMWHPQVREEVINVFRPNDQICQDVESLFYRQRDAEVEIIGIHIRRGDYRTFAGGRFYFSMEEYASMCFRLLDLLKTKKPERHYRFFISSNEEIPTKPFEGIDYFTNAKNTTAIHDLYALSLCDKILGPISTFSMWAAWYGAKPLHQVERESYMQFELNDFAVPKGFFQNW